MSVERDEEEKLNIKEILILKKLQTFLEPPKYFWNLPLKPGQDIFVKLGTKAPSLLKNYQIRIPEVLVLSNSSYKLLFTNKYGNIEVIDNYNIHDFWSLIERKYKKRMIERNEPAVIVQNVHERNPSYIDSEAFSLKEARSKYYLGPGEFQVIRRYIRPKGERYQINRLVYYTRNKSSYVVVLTNKADYYSQIYGYNQKYNHYDSNKPSFDIFFKSGSCISEFTKIAAQLVELIALIFGYRIICISLDFITDKKDKNWLINIRSFTLEESNKKKKELEYLHVIESQNEILKRLRQEAKDSEICKLCGCKYNKVEINKFVTARSVLEFYENNRQRRQNVDINFTITCEEFLSHSVRVCTLCYSLIVHDNYLSSLEDQLAHKLMIPHVRGSALKNYKKQHKFDKLKPNQMYQWRTLFHAIKIWIPSLPEIKKIKCTFKFNNSITNFQVLENPQIYKEEEMNAIDLRDIRLHYIFTNDTYLNNFFIDFTCEINLRINDINFSTTTYPFKDLINSENLTSEPKIYSKKVNLFSAQSDIIPILNVGFGIVCDGLTTLIPEMLIKEKGIYFTDDSCFIPLPLPDRWITFISSFSRNIKIPNLEEDPMKFHSNLTPKEAKIIKFIPIQRAGSVKNRRLTEQNLEKLAKINILISNQKAEKLKNSIKYPVKKIIYRKNSKKEEIKEEKESICDTDFISRPGTEQNGNFLKMNAKTIPSINTYEELQNNRLEDLFEKRKVKISHFKLKKQSTRNMQKIGQITGLYTTKTQMITYKEFFKHNSKLVPSKMNTLPSISSSSKINTNYFI